MMDGTEAPMTFAPEPEASSAWSRALHAGARRGPRMTSTELLRLLGDPGKRVAIDAVPESADGRPARDAKPAGN